MRAYSTRQIAIVRFAVVIVTGLAFGYMISQLTRDDGWVEFLAAGTVFGVGALFLLRRYMR